MSVLSVLWRLVCICMFMGVETNRKIVLRFNESSITVASYNFLIYICDPSLRGCDDGRFMRGSWPLI